ncbi:MAG: Crp/Fnr family transcriptional regulator [Acidobacteria bacterium]|nr:Crp/Fnr family transcriptional regulator [Acidobacteriota bacterium]MCW5947937.1 Crp/Fnr family transcriptional regulator [Pyrinomonadaceae bacterium]
MHTRQSNDLARRDLEIRHSCSKCDIRDRGYFCELHQSSVDRLEGVKLTKAYPKGTMLFVEGQPAIGVYLLCQGRVKLSTCSPEGKIMILGIAEPGDVLGLSAVIAGGDHESTAEVLEICQVNFVPADEFNHLLSTDTEVCLNAVRQLCRSYREAHRMVCSLGHSDSAVTKLAKLFLGWSRNGFRTNGHILVKNSFTHEEIAEMIGTTRETVTRSLRELRERGLVTLKGSDLIIHDPERLRTSAGVPGR